MPYQYSDSQHTGRPPYYQNYVPPPIQQQYVQQHNHAAYYAQQPQQAFVQQPPSPQFQVIIPPPPQFQYPAYPQYTQSSSAYQQHQQAYLSNQYHQERPPPQPDLRFPPPPAPSFVPAPSVMASAPQIPRVLQDVQPNGIRQQPPVVSVPKMSAPASNIEPDDELNYAELMLSLADEYLETASKIPYQSDKYCKLIATALGCMESTLANFKLAPLRETQLMLRYVQILYDETENYDDAERLLSKGIGICEQNNFHDLRYSMQLLLAKVLYLSRPKAALKDLESNIEELEVRKRAAWEYCLRFQHANLSLMTSTPADIHSAINQLERISAAARRNADHAILAYASACEALVHLSSPSKDAVTSAQQALAVARGLQLNPDITECPQLVIMLEFIDLCCSIKLVDNDETEKKRKVMQTELYNAIESPKWDGDGLLSLPLNRRSLGGVQLQQGGLISGSNDKPCIVFSWLPKEEVEALAYLFSAISVAHKNGNDGGKAEKFIHGGLDICHELQGKQHSTGLDNAQRRLALLDIHFLLERSFLYCAKGDWKAAKDTVDQVANLFTSLANDVPPDLWCVYQYVRGAIFQGCGELDEALIIFQSPLFELKATSNPASKISQSRPIQPCSQSQEEVVSNLSLLAAMNTILIINNASHPQHDRLNRLLSRVHEAVKTSPSTPIKAAYDLVLSANHSNNILTTKQYLGNALNAAQKIGNAQIMALTLVMMQEKIFKGIQSEQAIKCAKAAKQQAKRAGDPLWVAVATQLEADCLKVHNMHDQAAEKHAEAQLALAKLPDKVSGRF